MIADTYDPTTTIAAQQAARENAVVAEDSYYKSAGKIDRPLPDNWPWPVIKEAQQADDTADAALEAKVTQAEGKITTLEGKVTTAEGEIDTLQSDVSSLDSRVDALESPVAG